MRFTFTGSVEGGEDSVQVFRRRLNRVVAAASDMTRYAQRLANVFWAARQNDFASEGARGGTRWTPLTQAYQKEKTKAGFGGLPVMQRSQKLLDSLASPNAEYSVYLPTPRLLTLGTTHPAARAHHYGYPARNIPQRRLISVTREEKADYVRVVMDESERAARGEGFGTRRS